MQFIPPAVPGCNSVMCPRLSEAIWPSFSVLLISLCQNEVFVFQLFYMVSLSSWRLLMGLNNRIVKHSIAIYLYFCISPFPTLNSLSIHVISLKAQTGRPGDLAQDAGHSTNPVTMRPEILEPFFEHNKPPHIVIADLNEDFFLFKLLT